MSSFAAGVTGGQQQRALWLSTFAFTTCFAVWMIFSIIGIQIKQQLGLSETRFHECRRRGQPKSPLSTAIRPTLLRARWRR